MLLGSLAVMGQTERDYVRRGNRFMRDSLYDKAQVEYQKAIEVDNTSALAHYNLGNAFLHQNKPEEAMKEYEAATKLEKNPQRLAHIYHNMGTLLQSSQKLSEAIQCYKNALRNNPHADDTRYNYLLCLHQQKNGGDNQNQDNQNQDQNQDQDKKEQDQQQQDKKDQQNDQKQEEKEQEQPKPDPEQMSKENAEQMLKAAMQNEKETQEKIQQAQQEPQRKRLQKQW